MPIARIYQQHHLWVYAPVALAAMAAIAILWIWIFPIPSAHLRIATGAPEGVYHANAMQYAQKLAEHGVHLDVLPTAGSVENMGRITASPGSDNASDLALLQGGFGMLASSYDAFGRAQVQTLANVDVEPVWIFSRVREIDSLSQFQGLRVSIGPVGSGSRMVALKLFEAAGLRESDITISPFEGQAAVAAFEQGKLDIAMFVSSPRAPLVQAMVSTPGVFLVHLKRMAALAERVPYLEARLLPQGMLDPKNRYPAQDMSILATTARLVVRESLPPALKRLVTAAAHDVHGQASLFYKSGEFPNLKQLDFPASAEARKTLLHGLPWLERQVSFWWAQAIWRIVLIVLPVAVLAWGVARLVPAYFRWVLESRVNRWYGELKYIEHDLTLDSLSGMDLTKYHTRLEEMERAMQRFTTPQALMERFYILHQHIGFVRGQVFRLRGR